MQLAPLRNWISSRSQHPVDKLHRCSSILSSLCMQAHTGGMRELSHALSSSACFPHFVLTRCASLNRLSVSILAVLYGGRVCPAPQTSPYRFFNSFFSSFVECGIFDDCDLLQGCFTQANNYLRWGEHRESYSSTHSPSSPNQSTLPITLCQRA